MKDRYYSLPDAPEKINAQNVICRLLASIGFRYYWATAELTEEASVYRPSEDNRNIEETLYHIWDLLNWVYTAIESTGKTRPEESAKLREITLELIEDLESRFSEMDAEDLGKIELIKSPFWPVINGPLADVLTHIGQVSTLRRLAGDPVLVSNPFEGTPPSR